MRTLIARRPCNNLWLRRLWKTSYFHCSTRSLRSNHFSPSCPLYGVAQSSYSYIRMFGSLLELWEWVKIHYPASLFKKKHRLNFITIHCTSPHSSRLRPQLYALTDPALLHRSLYPVYHDHRINSFIPSRRFGIYRRPFLRQWVRYTKRS